MKMKIGVGRMAVKLLLLHVLFLYADDLILCGKLEEVLKVMVRHFVDV